MVLNSLSYIFRQKNILFFIEVGNILKGGEANDSESLVLNASHFIKHVCMVYGLAKDVGDEVMVQTIFRTFSV